MATPTPNELLAYAELLRLAQQSPQPVPGQVFILLPLDACEQLSALLFAESIRRREAAPV